VQLGDLVVGIASAEMGPLPLQNGRNSPDALSFKLRITNLSKQPLHYESWSGSSGVIVLKDQGNNFYNRVDFGPEEMPNGSFPRGDIGPGKTVTDLLVFEGTQQTYVDFDLELPMPDGSGSFRFRIPRGMVQKTQPPMGIRPGGTAPQAPVPVAPPVAP